MQLNDVVLLWLNFEYEANKGNNITHLILCQNVTVFGCTWIQKGLLKMYKMEVEK